MIDPNQLQAAVHKVEALWLNSNAAVRLELRTHGLQIVGLRAMPAEGETPAHVRSADRLLSWGEMDRAVDLTSLIVAQAESALEAVRVDNAAQPKD